MLFSYRAFGLEIVASAPISGLVLSGSCHEPDVRIHFGDIPLTVPTSRLYQSPVHQQSSSTLNVYELADGSFLFKYHDETTFVVSRSGSDVWVQWPAVFTQEDAVTYLLGPILGFILRLRGVVSLHASGIVIGDSAIALLGHAGAGKSTTAAAFARMGYPVVTDDVFALVDGNNSFLVQPGYAGLRLWPDSVESLWGSPDACPALTPNWDKRHVDLQRKEFTFAAIPMPVCAIYVLGERSDEPSAPVIRSEPAGFMMLLANTYVNYLLDKPARAHEFDILGRLARAVPIRRVIPHTQAGRLPQLCNLIIEDVCARTPSAVA